MEFLGRVRVEATNSLLPFELEHSLIKCKVVHGKVCVGLSRNNFLVEFNATNCDIKKGIKIEQWKCQDLDIVYEFGDKYLILLTKKDNEGFLVYEAFDHTFKLVHHCPERFLTLKPVDTVEGRQAVHVQYSPVRSKTLHFGSLASQTTPPKNPLSQDSSSFIEQFGKQKSKEEEQVSKSLLVQKKKAEKAVNDVKEEVEKLDKLINLAISDMTCNDSEFSINEADVLNGLFHGKSSSRRSPKHHLEVTEVRGFQMPNQENLIWMRVTNSSDRLIDNLRLLMTSAAGGQVQVLPFGDLDEMLKEDASRFILSETLGVQSLEDKQSLSSLEAHQSIIFVATTVKDSLQGQLQFKMDDRILTQKLDEIKAKNLKRLDLKEEILARIHLSFIRKSIKIESTLERIFDLHSALLKSGSDLKTVCKFRIYANSEVILIVTKINDFSYQVKIHTDKMNVLEEHLTLLDATLGKDVVFQLISVNEETQKERANNKYEALMDEIIAAENRQMWANEVITDRAFLFDY